MGILGVSYYVVQISFSKRAVKPERHLFLFSSVESYVSSWRVSSWSKFPYSNGILMMFIGTCLTQLVGSLEKNLCNIEFSRISEISPPYEFPASCQVFIATEL